MTFSKKISTGILIAIFGYVILFKTTSLNWFFVEFCGEGL